MGLIGAGQITSWNPQKVGQTLHITIPPLNSERQLVISKHAAQLAEQQKVAIRNIRRDARNEAKKFNVDDKIIDVKTSKYIQEIDKLLAFKISEIKGIKNLWKT